MAEYPMLVPMEPKEFFRQLREIMEEVVAKQSPTVANGRSQEHMVRKSLLKATEVCELFQVSKPTIYDWMRQGKLKSLKFRSRRYFLQRDVEELINASRVRT